MTLLAEIPRRPRLMPRLVKIAVASRESEQQILDFYKEPFDLSLSRGEPIAHFPDPRFEVTIATAKDLQDRQKKSK